jgi:hypothetical protein
MKLADLGRQSDVTYNKMTCEVSWIRTSDNTFLLSSRLPRAPLPPRSLPPLSLPLLPPLPPLPRALCESEVFDAEAAAMSCPFVPSSACDCRSPQPLSLTNGGSGPWRNISFNLSIADSDRNGVKVSVNFVGQGSLSPAETLEGARCSTLAKSSEGEQTLVCLSFEGSEAISGALDD